MVGSTSFVQHVDLSGSRSLTPDPEPRNELLSEPKLWIDEIETRDEREVMRESSSYVGARVDVVDVDGRESREGGGVAFDSLLDGAPLYYT